MGAQPRQVGGGGVRRGREGIEASTIPPLYKRMKRGREGRWKTDGGREPLPLGLSACSGSRQGSWAPTLIQAPPSAGVAW